MWNMVEVLQNGRNMDAKQSPLTTPSNEIRIITLVSKSKLLIIKLF